MSNIEMYIVTDCPNCKAENWMYYGDPNDQTYFTSEGLRCWSCKHCWQISDEEFEEDDYRNECYEDGRQFVEVK